MGGFQNFDNADIEQKNGFAKFSKSNKTKVQLFGLQKGRTINPDISHELK